VLDLCEVESQTASKLAGSDWMNGVGIIDRGLWEHTLCDPETAGAASLYVPLGPWATGI
jgi:hypothetical protein